jgi:uncharacterized membrane protein YsdA (DUF1294 family)
MARLSLFTFHKIDKRFFFKKNTRTPKELLWLFSLEEMWTTALNHLSQQIRQYFVRPESHQRALVYLQGLMSNASRKNA